MLYKFHYLKKLVLLLIVTVLGCMAPTDYSNIKVINVIDGDTVRLSNGELLRYIGIDTPEMRIKHGGTFVYSPQPFAKEATQLNQELVGGKFVRVEFDVEKRDTYRRLLGYCFIDEMMVNKKLVEEGLAVLYTKPPNIAYADELIFAQKQARKNKKGLWATYETIDHTQAHRYINQIRTVRGRIINTYDSGKVVFLNFGYNYKTDFTVVIFRSSLSLFLNKGINPVSFYRGKTVEVTGRIKEYNGPEIIVNIPEEIAVINQQ